MEDFIKKNKRGLIGTIGFHILAILILMFFSFQTPLPLPAEEGILAHQGAWKGSFSIHLPVPGLCGSVPCLVHPAAC